MKRFAVILALGIPFYALAGSSFDTLTSELDSRSTNGECQTSRDDLISIESARYDATASIDFLNDDSRVADWTCLALKNHLADDALESCTPEPHSVFGFVPDAPIKITGKETYHIGGLSFLGFRGFSVQKPYSYELSREPDGSVGVTVKVHFTGALLSQPDYVSLVKKQVAAAAEIWTRQSPDAKVRFHFNVVGADENPDFTVELSPSSFGDLYDSHWDSGLFKESISENTIAHEFGHMMGIPDEYDPARDSIWGNALNQVDSLHCNIRGMMCNHYRDKTYRYYYYLILRRALCGRQ